MVRRTGRLKSCVAAARNARLQGLRSSLSQFRREEEGSLLIFGLFCFVIMFLVAGIALDVMRHEERRTLVFNTMDRAALAAADLQQTLPPKDVVIDYFTKAGLEPPDPNSITVQEGDFGEYRTVQISYQEIMPTWFMRMVGIEELPVPGTSAAEERIGQVEISLVLDVSGSMGDNNRMVNLRPAAKAFVDQMFDTVEDGKLSISLVTYDTQVSAGAELLSYLPVQYTQGKSGSWTSPPSSANSNSYCLEFTAADFNSPALRMGNAAAKYIQNGHFDWDNNGAASTWNCPTAANREIMAFSGDRDALKARIDQMQPNNWTSIDVGAKWGIALLDPSLQPVVDGLIAANKRPSAFADRPYPYSDDEVLKVMVIMSDGANTKEFQLQPDKRNGQSIIMRNQHSSYSSRTDRNQYSIWDASRNQWYIVARNIWRNEPWGAGRFRTCNSCSWQLDPGATGNAANNTITPNPNMYRMDWREVWQTLSVQWVASNIVGRAWGNAERDRWNAEGGGTTVAFGTESQKDSRLDAICTAGKNAGPTSRQGVKIFSIAFEAPPNGKTVLKKCASSDSNYYEAQGSNIGSVFNSIANSINKLRLTQ